MTTQQQKVTLLEALLDRIGRRRRKPDGSLPPYVFDADLPEVEVTSDTEGFMEGDDAVAAGEEPGLAPPAPPPAAPDEAMDEEAAASRPPITASFAAAAAAAAAAVETRARPEEAEATDNVELIPVEALKEAVSAFPEVAEVPASPAAAPAETVEIVETLEEAEAAEALPLELTDEEEITEQIPRVGLPSAPPAPAVAAPPETEKEAEHVRITGTSPVAGAVPFSFAGSVPAPRPHTIGELLRRAFAVGESSSDSCA